MKWLPSMFLFVAVTLAGCETKRATDEQCRVIFDRLVVLELREMGFDDPALAKLRQRELASRYRKDLASCVGYAIPSRALECIAKAEDSEALSHDCLR